MNVKFLSFIHHFYSLTADLEKNGSLCTRMFTYLKNKWQVSWFQFVLIFSTFALGGSLCGFLGKKFMPLLAIENKAIWLVVYIIVVTILWPMCVILISIPFGQFNFFKNYLQKMWWRMSGQKQKAA